MPPPQRNERRWVWKAIHFNRNVLINLTFAREFRTISLVGCNPMLFNCIHKLFIFGGSAMARRRYLYVYFFLAFLLGTSFLRADVTGAVSGTVHDNSGAAIPGASVTITEVSTNVNHRVVSSADGQYTFLALVPGRYK